MPFGIGDFDSFWENYDSRSGPALVAESKEKIKTGDARPNWRLEVGTTNYSKRLISAEVTYSIADGSSGMRFTVSGSEYARRRERTAVRFWIGYGTKLVPYFFGQLAEPTDSRSGLYSESTAYGLGGRMGQLSIGGRLSYKNWTVENAWWDLIARFEAGGNPGGPDIDQFDFQSGVTDMVEADGAQQGFGAEHMFLEVEQTLFENMGLIAYDQIGGLRLVRRPARLDKVVDAPLVATFNESEYPADPGFTISANQRNIYDKVIVFRRSEKYASGGARGTGADAAVEAAFAGSTADNKANVPGEEGGAKVDEYAVYAERDVVNTSTIEISPHRIYWEADFMGTQAQAVTRAQQLANSFSSGAGQFEWGCFPVDLPLNEAFGVVRTEEVRAGVSSPPQVSLGPRYAVLYGCVGEEISLLLEPPQGSTDPGHFGMTMRGPTLERSRSQVRAGSSYALDTAVPFF